MIPPKSDDFQGALDEIFANTRSKKLPDIEVISGNLHKKVGGYPGQDHRMATCCHVMKRNMQSNDRIIEQPPKGKGATLKIKYLMPRW